MHSEKTNYSIEVKKVNNGFLVEESWREKLDPSKEFDEYKSERFVFDNWSDVDQFLQSKFGH